MFEAAQQVVGAGRADGAVDPQQRDRRRSQCGASQKQQQGQRPAQQAHGAEHGALLGQCRILPVISA